MDDAGALTRVIDDVVEPGAAEVDASGRFPRRQVEALAETGFLGMASATEVGGAGLGVRAVADVVERLARVCGSTAMVTLMHFCGVAVIEAHGPLAVRREIGEGRHLTSLALSEVGSRSHFWAPLSTAVAVDGGVQLDARKSWVTSAGQADSYVWSSRPVAGDGPMTLWLVPADARGLSVAAPFDGLGLRGNASSPITAEGTVVDEASRLGRDGAGLDVALSCALPWFLTLSAAFSLGLMEAAVGETVAHVRRTRLEHLDVALADQVQPRAGVARLRIETDAIRALVAETVAALEEGREDAMVKALEVKAAAGEAAAHVTDGAMQVCGGAAFRKELGIERRFRDARAARVMAPTTDVLLDLVGRALCGLPLLGAMVDQ
jgi:alkylation response protein AidB-like acyl-CoA dehydrogenase